ncbi:MAG TPA: hypothetical protein VFK52_07140 [Nocardioidaceae bacterium]|nr:hypothetical protein [Nocardioidaceae bacterium]
MFSSFEPAPPSPSKARTVVTVGSRSGPSRHEVAHRLATLGYDVRVLGGAGHFVGHDQPVLLAALVERWITTGHTGRDSPSLTT